MGPPRAGRRLELLERREHQCTHTELRDIRGLARTTRRDELVVGASSLCFRQRGRAGDHCCCEQYDG